jgi:hypothetical protein
MKAKTLCSTFAVAVILTVAPLELSAKTIGMVADDTTKSVMCLTQTLMSSSGRCFFPLPLVLQSWETSLSRQRRLAKINWSI